MNDLISNIDKLHTTKLGVERIKRNLGLDTDDVVNYCKRAILSVDSDSIVQKGKNWYVNCDGFTPPLTRIVIR
ncbi:hypothetical protein AGMMS50284_4980 [Clostridia bacterium]|nr:hypothetical protein AGMMS50284_4980 [Clostridia bacterium]